MFPLSGPEPGAAIAIKYANQRAPRVRRSRVKQRKMRWMMLVFALMAIMTLGACKKKVAPPPPPPPPAARRAYSFALGQSEYGR